MALCEGEQVGFMVVVVRRVSVARAAGWVGVLHSTEERAGSHRSRGGHTN